MNPALIAQFALPLLGKLARSGKLKGLIGGDQEATVAEVLNEQAMSPEAQVLAAIASLAEHAPADKGKAKDYADALSQVMQGLAVVKTLVAKGG